MKSRYGRQGSSYRLCLAIDISILFPSMGNDSFKTFDTCLAHTLQMELAIRKHVWAAGGTDNASAGTAMVPPRGS